MLLGNVLFATVPNAKTAKELSENPSRYLCGFGFYAFTVLIDMEPKAGALYIHSATEPHNAEQILSQG